MKRALSLILAIIAFVLCFAGCSKDTKEVADPSPSPSASESVPNTPDDTEAPAFFPLKDSVEIDFWCPWSFYESAQVFTTYADSICYQVLEERTNVSLKWTMPTLRAEKEALNLLLASDDLPDVIVNWPLSGYAVQYAIDNEVGIVVDEYVEQFMPIYQTKIADPDVRRDITMDNGEMGAIWALNREMQQNWNGMCIRKDFLDRLNLQIPETYDEMYDVLVAFRDELKLPAPMNLASYGDHPSYLMAGGFGAIGTIYQKDGIVKYGPLEPEFRSYIEMMRKWYSEGLIDPDFESNDPLWGNGEVMLLNDEVGYTVGVDCIGTWADNGGAPINKDFLLYPMKNLVLNNGENTHFGVKKKIVEVPTIITTQAENKEVIFRWMDFCFSEESFILLNYGVEDKTFFYDEENYPTMSVEWVEDFFNCTFTNNFAKSICSTRMPYEREQYMGRDTKKTDIENLNETYFLSGEIWGQDDGKWLFPEGVTCSLSGNEQAEYSPIFSDCETLYLETVVKVIKGIEDMSAWDEMITTMKEQNIDRAVAIKQESLDRYNNRINLIKK